MSDESRRTLRTGLLLALGVCAITMVHFFDDANPSVALTAFAAWCCFLIAIYKVR